jgi:Ser/Thr protein kinase RdoA (MazF antagonist)
VSTDFEAVAAYCGLGPVRDIELLPAGLENDVCALTTPNGRQVLRVSQQRSVRQVDAEVSFVSELRALGFKVAPRFLPLQDDQFVVSYQNLVVSSYEYFEGALLMHLTEPQFHQVLQWMELLIQAEQRINPSVLAARSAFPEPTSVAQRFARLLERAEPTEIGTPYLEQVSRFIPPGAIGAIHSDIHVKNLIWNGLGDLNGFIDFDDCCVGSQLIEFATFVRGICFAPVADFKLDRLAATWDRLKPYIFRGGARLQPEEVFTSLLWSCMYFAVVVNRPRPHTGVPELKMQDILRTQELIRHRAAILQVLR